MFNTLYWHIGTQNWEMHAYKLDPDNTSFQPNLLLLSHFSHIRLCATPQMAAHQAPPSLGFSGGGCHFLLQCMKVKSESEVAQSCPTVRDPMDRSLPGSSVHGSFQARVLEWEAIAFSKEEMDEGSQKEQTSNYKNK